MRYGKCSKISNASCLAKMPGQTVQYRAVKCWYFDVLMCVGFLAKYKKERRQLTVWRPLWKSTNKYPSYNNNVHQNKSSFSSLINFMCSTGDPAIDFNLFGNPKLIFFKVQQIKYDFLLSNNFKV